MSSAQRVATAILAIRDSSPLKVLVLSDVDDETADEAKMKARREHPLQNIHTLRIKHVEPGDITP